jgi:hypothetical protein
MKPQFMLFDRDTGLALKHDALKAFESKAQAWLSLARNAAERIHYFQGVVTSDDVLETVGYPPTTLHWNVIGAIFKESEWQICGYVPSRRTSAHGRRITVWKRKT